MAISLHALLSGLEAADAEGAREALDALAALPAGTGDLEIRGVCHDSRRCRPGDLYVAIVGARFDGRAFAGEAVSGGAVAVLGPAPEPAGDAAHAPPPVPWIAVDDPRALLAALTAGVYGAPHESMVTVGITGTNGKSTVSVLAADVLTAAGRPAAVLGTLGCHFQERTLDIGQRTTPEVTDLFHALDVLRREGAEAAALEISSHALDLGRLGALSFDVAVFTNLSRDHLDHHGSMESYFAAKRKIFERLKPGGTAVVSVGDEWGRRLADELADALGDDLGLLTYGLDDGDVCAASARLDLDGITATVETPRGEVRIHSKLLGRYNLENVLAAVAVGEALELDPQVVAEALAQRGAIPGRLEPVRAAEDQPFPALVDYAHTPGALEAALTSLREISERKILCVFGCGGERDRGKRPQMGEVAGRLADLPILTSDNPRREDPMQILAEVEEGVKRSGNDAYRLVPDRGEAIRRAVEVALRRQEDADDDGPGWLVLLAGKGHETTQDLGDRIVPFSDRGELETAIRDAEARHG